MLPFCFLFPKLRHAHLNLYLSQELSRDEDIWKKIDAIRVIVGFNAPRRVSYVEELKALYLFTGIEPPSSSMDSSDTLQFSNKLNFLMSVIGLKWWTTALNPVWVLLNLGISVLFVLAKNRVSRVGDLMVFQYSDIIVFVFIWCLCWALETSYGIDQTALAPS